MTRHDGNHTHHDLVVMPGLVTLNLPPLTEASRTEVDLLTFLRGALYPHGVGDIDMTCLAVSSEW